MNAPPQIALVNTHSWAVIGPFSTHTGLATLWPLPQLDCTVLNTSLPGEEAVHHILQVHIITPAGVDNVEVLVDALLQAGARLLIPLPSVFPISQNVSQ